MFRKDVNSTIPSKFHKKIGKINYSSQSSPSLKPKKIKPRRRVVFVNPDDDHYLYCIFFFIINFSINMYNLSNIEK